jgi:hypothetical protein
MSETEHEFTEHTAGNVSAQPWSSVAYYYYYFRTLNVLLLACVFLTQNAGG